MTRTRGIWLGVAVLVLASFATVLASDNNSGEYKGGFVMSNSLDGVNPVYHPRIFGVRQQVVVPQPQAYCFQHGPQGWFCNPNGPTSVAAAAAALHNVPTYAKAPIKAQVVYHKPPAPKPLAIHPVHQPIDPRVVVTCLFGC